MIGYHRFRELCCLHFHFSVKMEAACSSETLVLYHHYAASQPRRNRLHWSRWRFLKLFGYTLSNNGIVLMLAWKEGGRKWPWPVLKYCSTFQDSGYPGRVLTSTRRCARFHRTETSTLWLSTNDSKAVWNGLHWYIYIYRPTYSTNVLLQSIVFIPYWLCSCTHFGTRATI
jgi:hypothetical protein